MKKQISSYITLCLTALLLVTTSCSNEDVAPVMTEYEVSVDLPSFDPVAEQLTRIFSAAGANNWMGQTDLLMRILQPAGELTPAEIEAAESGLGITHAKLDRLITDLGYAAQNYTRALTALNLSTEDRKRMIRDDVASSVLADFAQNGMTAEDGRCFLQDICIYVGYFLVDVWLALTCEYFCEEEALPYQILVNEICFLFPC